MTHNKNIQTALYGLAVILLIGLTFQISPASLGETISDILMVLLTLGIGFFGWKLIRTNLYRMKRQTRGFATVAYLAILMIWYAEAGTSIAMPGHDHWTAQDYVPAWVTGGVLFFFLLIALLLTVFNKRLFGWYDRLAEKDSFASGPK